MKERKKENAMKMFYCR